MGAFEQGRKIADTPFPFLSAQFAVACLVLYAMSVPFVIAAWIPSRSFGGIFTFIVVWAYWSLHEVARDLEDPFMHEPNELPLPALQLAFNMRLTLMLKCGFSEQDAKDRSQSHIDEYNMEYSKRLGPSADYDAIQIGLNKNRWVP